MPDDRSGAASAIRIAEETRLVHDADHPAGVGHRAQLLVVDVAPVAMHTGDAGVRDDERLRAVVHAHGVEETGAVDVRQVDEDPFLIEPAYEVAAEGREAPGAAARQRRAG